MISTGSVSLKAIDVKGKFMWWTFDSSMGPCYMFCTYGMAAQWVPYSPAESKHAGFFFWFVLDDDSETPVSFEDPRHFGTLKFVFDKAELDRKLRSLGADPLVGELDPNHFFDLATRTAKGDKPICEILMDQRVFSGVGNYIRAEALWRACIDPWKKGSDLSLREWKDLCVSIRDVMLDSAAAQGATLFTYKTISGARGNFELKVYGRQLDSEGDPVSRQMDSNGRTVHWSPARQV